MQRVMGLFCSFPTDVLPGQVLSEAVAKTRWELRASATLEKHTSVPSPNEKGTTYPRAKYTVGTQ